MSAAALKKIEAIIKPGKWDDVKKAFQEIGVNGATITEVKVTGPVVGVTTLYRDMPNTVTISMYKVEVVVPAPVKDQAVEAVMKAARTGRPYDGMIFVSSAEQTVHIRSGSTKIDQLMR